MQESGNGMTSSVQISTATLVPKSTGPTGFVQSVPTSASSTLSAPGAVVDMVVIQPPLIDISATELRRPNKKSTGTKSAVKVPGPTISSIDNVTVMQDSGSHIVTLSGKNL